MVKIDCFDTEWSVLSNFAMSEFTFQGVVYQTAEHAFQSSKVLNLKKRQLVVTARTPAEAKLLGNLFKDHPSWDKVKVGLMEEILEVKFTSNSLLAQTLLSTGDAILEEGNKWGDDFWGVFEGQGSNHLGIILMKVRSKLIRGELKIVDASEVSKILAKNQNRLKTVKLKSK